MSDSKFIPDPDELDEGESVLRIFKTTEAGQTFLSKNQIKRRPEYNYYDKLSVRVVLGRYKGKRVDVSVPCLVGYMS